MTANFSYPSNVSSTADLFTTYVNDVTGGLFGMVILLMIFIVAIISMQKFDNIKSPFAASSFIVMILAILFRMMEIIPDWVLFISIIMTLFGLAGLVFGKE